MIKINAKLNSDEAGLIAMALTPDNYDPTMRTCAARALGMLVRETPKRWFGQLRRAWVITRETIGAYQVTNKLKSGGYFIMACIENGTANEGTGWITPKRSKALYIPQNRKAAMGWNSSLVRGGVWIARSVKFLPAPVRRRVTADLGEFVDGNSNKMHRFLVDGDYLLLKRVRGIRPRRIVQALTPKINEMVVQAMTRYLKGALR